MRVHHLPRLVHRLAPGLLLALATCLAPLHAAAQSPTSRAVARFDQGDLAGARSELEALVRADPRDADALYYLGRTALQQERSGEAVEWLEKAIRVNDGVAHYHVWLGAALGEEAIKASKFRQPFLARRVKTEFERAVALDPRNAMARFGLVQFYAVAPGFMGGGMDKARQQVAELARVDALQGHLATAYLTIRERDTVATIRAYEAAITTAPDSGIGYLSLGALYQRLERWGDAFATYDRLLARHPDGMSARFQVGRTAALSGQRLERGEQALRGWIAKPPRNAPRTTIAGAHHRLGQILERTNRRDAARTEFEEALRINPRNDDARQSLAALPRA
jgi:tetratricopeptide (TPR) repeat protein